jgi:hypothetical protein
MPLDFGLECFSQSVLFGLCLRIAIYRNFANTKQGDFFVVWLPFRLSMILPHPYDFYVVSTLVTKLLWIWFLTALVFAGLYFWQRNLELKKKACLN